MMKAVRIGDTLETFTKEHPEVKIRRFNGKITCIQLPEDAVISILDIRDGQLISLEYLYHSDTPIRYNN